MEGGDGRPNVAPRWAGWLRLLGGAALACGVASLCLARPALVALPLGVAVMVMASRDLARMGRGDMDPAGRADTIRAGGWAFWGAALAVPVLAVAAFALCKILAGF